MASGREGGGNKSAQRQWGEGGNPLTQMEIQVCNSSELNFHS